MIKKLLISIFILVQLTSCTAPRQLTFRNFQPKDPRQLRVASYNLNWGELSWKKRHLINNLNTIHAIHVVNADVVFLQECTDRWEVLFNQKLVHQYPYRKFLHYYENHDGRGLGVLSKYPIHSKKYIYSLSQWYPAWQGYLDTKFGKIQFLNVHLLPTLYGDTDLETLSPYSAFSSSSMREKDFIGYMSRVDHYAPTIIAGDFNENDDGRTINDLRAQGWIDTSFLLKKRTYTWHWPVAFLTFTDHLDHMFYTPSRIHAVRMQVLHEGDSDHYPIVVDFER